MPIELHAHVPMRVDVHWQVHAHSLHARLYAYPSLVDATRVRISSDRTCGRITKSLSFFPRSAPLLRERSGNNRCANACHTNAAVTTAVPMHAALLQATSRSLTAAIVMALQRALCIVLFSLAHGCIMAPKPSKQLEQVKKKD